MSDVNPMAGFEAFMHDASAYLYLIAAVCFIMALRGLSSPESSRAGNMYGMVGMTIAVLTTLASPGVVSYGTILAGIVIGGRIFFFVALTTQMSTLPLLVAAPIYL